jgi:hypothetical protein
MDAILKQELESGYGALDGTYSVERQAEIRQKYNQMCEVLEWIKENQPFIPPRFAVMFNLLACDVLRSAGYIVNLDPGEMPS